MNGSYAFNLELLEAVRVFVRPASLSAETKFYRLSDKCPLRNYKIPYMILHLESILLFILQHSKQYILILCGCDES